MREKEFRKRVERRFKREREEKEREKVETKLGVG